MKKLFVLFAALALVVSAVPAMAAQWDFYGSARMGMWVETGDAQPFLNQHWNGQPGQGDTELTYYLQGNSRIGAKVKHGTVSGYFEYGTGVNVRKLYATWKPENAGWSLLVGQTYTPVNLFYSGQVYASDEGLLSTGGIYDGRHGMIQFQWEGLKLALVELKTATSAGMVYPGATPDADGVPGDVDVWLPKLEASYHFGADQWFFDVVGGFTTYQVEDPLGGERWNNVEYSSQDIRSFIVGAGGGVNFGPAYVKAHGYYGQNTGSFGMYDNSNKLFGKPILNPTGQNGAFPTYASTASNYVVKVNFQNGVPTSYDYEDTTTWGLLGVVGFKLNDMVAMELGASYLNHSNDLFVDDGKVLSAYFQAPLTLAKGVYIIPEVGYYNPDTRLDTANIVTLPDGSQTFTSVDADDWWYFGAKFQINF